MLRIGGVETIISFFDKILLDLEMMKSLGNNPAFMDQLRIILANNFQSVWDSQGSVIGEDWNGRDLNQTGELKASLTNASRIRITQVGNLFIVSSDVYYAEEVNEEATFYKLSPESEAMVRELITRFLVENGNTQWS